MKIFKIVVLSLFMSVAYAGSLNNKSQIIYGANTKGDLCVVLSKNYKNKVSCENGSTLSSKNIFKGFLMFEYDENQMTKSGLSGHRFEEAVLDALLVQVSLDIQEDVAFRLKKLLIDLLIPSAQANPFAVGRFLVSGLKMAMGQARYAAVRSAVKEGGLAPGQFLGKFRVNAPVSLQNFVTNVGKSKVFVQVERYLVDPAGVAMSVSNSNGTIWTATTKITVTIAK